MIQWFKRHPDLLRKDSTALSNDSNYSEIFQERNNYFVSHGNVIVRLNKVHKFPFMILYPNAYPFRLPLLFPLNRLLTKEEIIELAEKGTNCSWLVEVILFHYKLRHQNASGALCIIEWDNLDDGTQFYGITSIIQRLRSWCEGLVNGNFPLDSQEIELFYHFNNISSTIKLAFPEYFLMNDVSEGLFWSTVLSIVPKNQYKPFETWFYIGNYLAGANSINILVESPHGLPKGMKQDGIENQTDLFTKPVLVHRLLDSKKYIQGCWFDIENEPSPFESVNDLVELIGNGNFDSGLKRLYDQYHFYLKDLPDSFIAAIRYKNRREIKEFQAFQIQKNGSNGIIIGDGNRVEVMRSIILNYSRVEIIESEKFSDDSFFARNGKRADYEILKDSSTNILGVGAIGSEIADCLAKAGVGKIHLFDNQTFKAHNAVRHLVGINRMGEAKVNSVAEILSNHNPFTTIFVSGQDVTAMDVNKYFPENSISVSSIADDNVEAYINQQSVTSGKVVFYSRALRGGKVGRIFRVIPGVDACFHCLNLYRNEGHTIIEVPEDEDYPTIKNECNNPIRPASAADLKLIAALTSRLVIEHMHSPNQLTNHWIWTSESLKHIEIQPYAVNLQFIPPHPKCCYCSIDQEVEVIVLETVLDELKKMVQEKKGIETGGILAGFIDGDGRANITHISGPGPKAVHATDKFEKDVEYCQKLLDKLYEQYGDKAVYIGEWHSHPNSNNSPSNTDIQSMAEIALQKEYLTDQPVMIIFSTEGLPSCTVHPAGKRFYKANLIVKNN